jgi:ATP phosphoribosyltransferase
VALPTGDLRAPVAAALAAAGLHCDDYARGSRALRLSLAEREDVALRVFREKDIPIQIALGNYDLAICSAAWVEELHARFPQEQVTVIRPLDFGGHRIVAAASPEIARRLGPLDRWAGARGVRIVSEYPGMAERLARSLRLARYTVLPLWGAAEAYPPEDADLVLLNVPDARAVRGYGLEPLATLLDGSAWLIAARDSLARRDLSAVLGPLLRDGSGARTPERLHLPRGATNANGGTELTREARATVRLAIPDGHAQRHTFAALTAAGLAFDGYGEKEYVRRPASGIDGLTVKVIRPQDMPQQVALGNFDAAITGRDILMDHLWAFPSSPVREAVDLGRSRYGIAAAVSEDVPADTLAGALGWWRSRGITTIRVASEYPNIADHFARLRYLGRYQVIPVNGASEAFVPEDSEILIEGTETGSSFRANRLKAIDRMFESTNCVITGTAPLDPPRRALLDALVERLRRSVVEG